MPRANPSTHSPPRPRATKRINLGQRRYRPKSLQAWATSSRLFPFYLQPCYVQHYNTSALVRTQESMSLKSPEFSRALGDLDRSCGC
jgi:hypothetical protein